MQEALFINIRSKRLLKTTSYLFSSRTVQQSVGSSLILSLEMDSKRRYDINVYVDSRDDTRESTDNFLGFCFSILNSRIFFLD